MFSPIQQSRRLLGLFGSCFSSGLRVLGAVFSPAKVWADTLDSLVLKVGLLDGKGSAQNSAPLDSPAPVLKHRGYIDWMEKQLLLAIVTIVRIAWSGLCLGAICSTLVILPVASTLFLPAIFTGIAGCTTVRILLSTKNAAAFVIKEICNLAKSLLYYCLDFYWPDWKVCIVSWFDDHIPQHANQMRFLLSELPRGQSLPTIEEEDEETQDDDHNTTSQSHAHLANIDTNTRKFVDNDSKSANIGSVFDMHARSV